MSLSGCGGEEAQLADQQRFCQYFEAGTWREERRKQTNGWPDSLLGSCRRLETRRALSARSERRGKCNVLVVVQLQLNTPSQGE